MLQFLRAGRQHMCSTCSHAPIGGPEPCEIWCGKVWRASATSSSKQASRVFLLPCASARTWLAGVPQSGPGRVIFPANQLTKMRFAGGVLQSESAAELLDQLLRSQDVMERWISVHPNLGWTLIVFAGSFLLVTHAWPAIVLEIAYDNSDPRISS